MVSQRNLVNFLNTMQQCPGISADDRVLSLTSLSFDIAGLELYLPLISGASVVLSDAASQRDPSALLHRIREAGVSLVQATPSTWRMLLSAPDVDALRGCTLLCGGEALPADIAQQLVGLSDGVYNVYGPTETTIWSSVQRLSADAWEPLLGRGIGNTQLYVLDARLQPVPAGVAGELYIGGDGVTRGYYQRADLTAERFVPDLFSATPGARLYRTGDEVRYRNVDEHNSNGLVLEYIGRLDHQVKIRGFRIELGEIENALLTHPSISAAAVVASDGVQAQQLVAYVVPVSSEALASIDTPVLKAHLSALLPEYMVPNIWQVLEAMPLTPNGKLDRKQLPAVAIASQQREYLAPVSELEQSLASLWQEVLSVEQVGLADDFFALGGHSLLAAQVIAHMKNRWQISVPLRTLFEYSQLNDFVAASEKYTVTIDSETLDDLESFLDEIS